MEEKKEYLYQELRGTNQHEMFLEHTVFLLYHVKFSKVS